MPITLPWASWIGKPRSPGSAPGPGRRGCRPPGDRSEDRPPVARHPDRAVGVADRERFQQGRFGEAARLQVSAAFRLFEQRLVIELGRLVQQRLLLRGPRRRRVRRGDLGGCLDEAAAVLGEFANRLTGRHAVVEDEEVNAASPLPQPKHRQSDFDGVMTRLASLSS